MLPSCISCTHDYGASTEYAVHSFIPCPATAYSNSLLPGVVFYWWFATVLKKCQELYAVRLLSPIGESL